MSRNHEVLDTRALMREALAELDRLQRELVAERRARAEPVAIVGLGCRFPGAAGPDEFWQLLRAGRDAIVDVPADRWDREAYYDPDPDLPGKMVTRRGGFLSDVAHFDARFFGIAPREAVYLDPQQRLLLEVAWEALEYAGIAADQLQGSPTGVFVGICHSDYLQRIQQADDTFITAHLGTGNALSVASGRLSYVLGLCGPSLSVDTACSSSLLAVHLAVQSLRMRECDLALAGGVNVMLAPQQAIHFSKAHMLAADDRCKTFDAAADGYVRGEGCGIVVLKRLADALAAGDLVLAVIRGSATNQDGKSAGLTAPCGPAQEAVIHAALRNADIGAEQIFYVEAHGTGTALGDPIELHALRNTLTAGRSSQQPLWVGSVKTSIGHLEAAAGVAALIKVVLALQHEELPPQLHFQQLNPQIQLDGAPIRIATDIVPWPQGRDKRVAGVSSFGFSGTNVHMIVTAPPDEPNQNAQPARVANDASVGQTSERPAHVLVLSARSETALRELAGRFARHLSRHDRLTLTDVCYTTAVGRAAFEYRLALVCGSVAAAASKLAALAAGEQPDGAFLHKVPPGWQALAVRFSEDAQHAVTGSAGRVLWQQLPSPAASSAHWEAFCGNLAAWHAQGAAVDWEEYYRGLTPRRVVLPTYPFQRQRYWFELPATSRAPQPADERVSSPTATTVRLLSAPDNITCHPLLGRRVPAAFPTFESRLCTDSLPYLADHRILGLPVLPAAAYLELAMAAAREAFDSARCEVADVQLLQMLVVPSEPPRVVQCLVTPDPASEGLVTVCGLAAGEVAAETAANWSLHAQARIVPATHFPEAGRNHEPLSAVEARVGETLEPGDLYARLEARGLGYGPAFRRLARICRREGEALAELRSTDLPDGAAAGIHPALLDAALQTIAAALPADVRESRDASALLPVTIERYRVHGDCPEPQWSHAAIRPSPASFPARILADVRLLDALGHLVAEICGVGFEGVELSQPLPPSARGREAAAGAGRGTGPSAPPPTLTDTMPGDDRSPRAILRSVPPAERPLLLERYLTRELADALGAETGQLPADEPLHTLGLDSFMIVRLATRLERELGVEVPLGRLMQGPSVAELTAELLRQLDEVP